MRRSSARGTAGGPAKDGRSGAEPAALLARIAAAIAELDAIPTLDDERFLETHTLFEDRSNQRAAIVDALVRRVRERALSGGTARVLAVGCGNGAVDVPLARALAERHERVVYRGIDPNRAQLAVLAEQFDAAGLDGVELEVFERTFEGHEAEARACGDRFELVHFVHSLYYVDDPAAALDQAHALLAPGGELAVVHAPRAELNELAALFYDGLYGRPTLFADEVVRHAEARGWRFERERVDARVDLTALFEGPAAEAEALRDFVVQVDARRLPADLRELVERYLRLVSRREDGRALAPHPVDAVFIR